METKIKMKLTEEELKCLGKLLLRIIKNEKFGYVSVLKNYPSLCLDGDIDLTKKEHKLIMEIRNGNEN